MTEQAASQGGHSHNFLGHGQARNARRPRLVIALTAGMMVVEVAAGLLFGSMALLADGWHMASHAAALSITALAYWLARRHADNPRFCFGTGKVGDLAGFSSALLLAFIALLMGYESVVRLFNPVGIAFNQAILVAVIGLVVNLVSALMLKEEHHHGHGHEHEHQHDHGNGHRHSHDHSTDHNLKSAYLHVVADALTSLLAIAALSAGKYLGWVWMDPVMGLVGAVVIARWSWRLMFETGQVLLDASPRAGVSQKIRAILEDGGQDRITDLHVWRLGPGHLGAIVAVSAAEPQPPAYYKDKLAGVSEISHLTVEVDPRA